MPERASRPLTPTRLTRPTRAKAVALRYWAGLPAPFLAAKAEGRSAARLVAIAREADLPIIEDEPLVQAIFPLDVGNYVPEDCFEIVARVFAFVKRIEET
jgi:type III secretion system FlhB-like substrate exporter